MRKTIVPVVLMVLLASRWVDAQEPSTTQMSEQIRTLQEKVDRLEKANGSTTKPVEVVAEHRAPTQDTTSVATGGWDGSQFTLKSNDGNFTLHPGAVVDFRNITTYRDRSTAGDDTQNGFDVGRLRLLLDGTLFKQVGYVVQFQADGGTSVSLLDAALSYRFGDSPFYVKAGQFKDPVWHERNISEANQIAVDRSLIEFFLGGGQSSRVQGASLYVDSGRFRGQVVAHDGVGSAGTRFFDSGGVPTGVGGIAGVAPVDFGFSGRAEYMLVGDRTNDFNPYAEYDQFTSFHAKVPIVVVGGGIDYTQGGANDLILHSADVQFNHPCGLGLYAGFLGTYRHVNTNDGVPVGSYYDAGFIAQASYVMGKFEPFARYDYIHLDPSSTRQVSGLRSHLIQEMTVGVNYYLYGQKLKLTVDGSFLPNGLPIDVESLGFLRDSGRNEVTVRAQIQLAI